MKIKIASTNSTKTGLIIGIPSPPLADGWHNITLEFPAEGPARTLRFCRHLLWQTIGPTSEAKPGEYPMSVNVTNGKITAAAPRRRGRGRPAKAPDQAAATQIQLRATASRKAAYETQAAKSRQTLTAWIFEALDKAANYKPESEI